MLTALQHLLTKLAEECAEVAQIALKTQQFGPSEIMPGQPLTNFQRTHQEIDDLLAVVEMLNEQHGFGYSPNKEWIANKKAKVVKYLAFSVARGMVEGESGNPIHPMDAQKGGVA